MLIYDLHQIGDRLFSIRKQYGMTQAEVAEAAGLSDRTYSEMERGIANMRIETVLRVCDALHITPDEILTESDEPSSARKADLLARLDACSPHDRETAYRLLDVYLQSLPHNQ